ncbi:condensation domain-containing protein [Variovorax sp. J22R133]|uniref:condensation domain-containing protein n=1 Tax=Variovorax brevis TaxID=3053503 RepID=UPI002574D49D|nr:condensation domain-containing protein [Variovorax sp. J22R133]MDM0116496.1 condensation domain-containing protein [Variovorax sp. J22R133]
MSSIDFINRLAAQGIKLWTDNGKLQYQAPRNAMTPELLDSLRQHKQALIDLLEQFGDSAGSFPLSQAQRSLWSLHQLDPHSAAYNVTYACRLDDALDTALLTLCIDYLIARHPILRTRYEIVDGQPQQRVGAEPSARLEVSHAHALRRDDVVQWIEREANAPFDLRASPIRLKLLVNAAASGDAQMLRHVLLLNVHHIAADFWSLEIMVRELESLYRLGAAGQAMRLAPIGLQYRDFVRHESERLSGSGGQALADFWKAELEGGMPVLALGCDHPRPPVKTENGRIYNHVLGAGLTRAARQVSKANHVTPYMLLLGVYQLLLHKHSGQTRIVIGAPMSGRNLPGSEQVLGHFVNTVPLGCELSPGQRFADLLARTRSMMLRVLNHQDYPFPLLVETLRPQRDPSRSPVFQVMFNWNQQRGASDGGATPASPLFGEVLVASSTGTRGATHDLTLNILNSSDTYTAAWTFNTDLFNEASIARMATQYERLLEQVLADPTRPLSSYCLADADVHARTLRTIAAAGMPAADASSPLPASFDAAVQRSPTAPAVQCAAGVLSFGQLDQARQAWVSRLRGHGVGKGGRVGIALHSVVEQAVLLLALLQVGANAYRVAADASTEGLDVVVRSPQPQWSGWAPALMAFERGSAGTASDRMHPPLLAGPSAPSRFIEGVGQALCIDAASRLLLLEHGDTNLAVACLASSLCCGAHVHIRRTDLASGEADDRDAWAGALLAELSTQRLDCAVLPALLMPAVLRRSEAGATRWLAYGEHPQALRQSFRGTWLRFLPDAGLHPTWGPLVFEPTESGWRWLQQEGGATPVLLGAAGDLADERQFATLHLVMDARNACLCDTCHDANDCGVDDSPVDVAASLRAALGARALHATPFTLRRMGGTLHCEAPAGRRASHRATPLDIAVLEQALASACEPGELRELAVLMRDTAEGPALTAYLVATHPSAPDFSAALRQRLKLRLPDAVLPDAFVVLDRLPLHADGRLDEARLPAPDIQAMGRTASTETEHRLAAVWREVMSLTEVGVDDDFFALGGDSILAAVIVSKASAEGLYMKPRDLFQYPTIAALARVVSTTPAIAVEQAPLVGLVEPGPAAAWFFDAVQVDRSHFNQALLLEMREVPDAALMDTTLRLLAQQHDALRSRFEQVDGRWQQRFLAIDAWQPPAWVAIDCTDASSGSVVQQTWHDAIAAAQSSLDIEGGPLWQMRWLDAGPLSASRLLFVAHHLLVDGVSWSILLQDMADIYASLKAGAQGLRPAKTSSTSDWVQAWRARMATGALADDERYWSRFAAQMNERLSGPERPALMRHALRPPAARSIAQPHGSCQVSLDAGLSMAFRTTAHRAYGTDANDLLVAALHAGFNGWCDSKAMLLDLEGHGRDALADTVDLGRSVGWFTSIYPVLIEGVGLDAPDRLIKHVKQRLREVPNKGASFGALRYLAPEDAPVRQALAAMPPSPVLFTYLGAIDQPGVSVGPFTGTATPAPGIRSDRQPRTHLLDIYAFLHNGRLTIEAAFTGGGAVEDSMGCLLQRVADALGTLLRHCTSPGAGGMTPSDVPDIEISQDGLDSLLAELSEAPA